MTKLGAGLLEQLLAADTGHRGQRVDCGAGHQAEFVSYRTKTFDTVLGPIECRRAYYHCADCGHGVVPRDEELGVAGASLTPGLAGMVDRVGAAVPFAKGRGLLAELAGVTLSAKRVERCAEADGRACCKARDVEAAALASGELVPLGPATPVEKLYVALDGTGVPTVPAGTEGRAGRGPDGRAHTREVKLAVAFTQTTVDEEGFAVRDPRSSGYVATFEPVEHFGALVYAEARRRGSHKAKQLVVLGDGAVWIWNLAAFHFPGATHIVDLTTPANTSTISPACSPQCSETTRAPGWPQGKMSSTTATLRRSSPLPANSTSPPPRPPTSTRRSGTSRTTQDGCATPTSAEPATSSGPARWKPAARRWSASGSSCPGCAGACQALPASSPCAARKPAIAGRRSGSDPTARAAQPDPSTYKFVGHPNGFYPVLYGSTGTSDLTSFASISSVPDAIYGALWDGDANVDDLSPVPSGYWVDNQRYKQFQGNVYETYNTAKIEVDNDCAGSLVWTDNTANPSNCA